MRGHEATQEPLGIPESGFSVDGGVLTPRKDLNEAYFGKPVTPTEILIKGAASPDGAKPLLATATKAASGK